MPLKLIPPRPGKTPYWAVKGTYLGTLIDGRSTKTSDRKVAKKVLAQFERDIESGRFAAENGLTFADAAKSYMQAGGERTYVKALLHHFGTMRLSDIGQSVVDGAAAALYPRATAATKNRQVYTPVSAILRHSGIKLDLKRPKGSAGNKQTFWLKQDEVFALLNEAEKLDKRFGALLTLLFYTGMRLGDALGLTWDKVELDRSYAYLPTTKNGEPRGVFLHPEAVAALANLDRCPSGRCFGLAKSGHLYSLLRAAAARGGVTLPERSAFHAFRHTWASMMYPHLGIKGLVDTGNWADAKSAERYAHTHASEEAKKVLLLPARKA